MIIKTKVRAGAAKLADYLLKSEKNERAELLEMRGFSVDNLKAALGIEEELAESATRCEKPFYHVAFRAAPGEELTPEQWRHCADKLEQAVGLENHHRALVLHEKDGEQHMHAVYSRIDPETLKAVNLYRDHYHAKETAREIERELGLTRVRDKAPERELAAPTFGEDQQARRKGQDLEKARAMIREAWERSDDGKSFADELKERGFTLAQGERRDFVALDEEGSVYSIGKRTTGARAAEVREKLADLERTDLPTVDQVREQQREERQREREESREREQEGREIEREAPPMEQTAAPALDLVPDKGADRALGAVADGALKALDGFLDFFVGPTPKAPERPRYKSNAELDAENKAARRDEIDRRARMTEEEREQEREKRSRERERERERDR